VPTSAYPLAFPEALASSAILPQRALVGTYSLDRPAGESHSVVPPFHCPVFPYDGSNTGSLLRRGSQLGVSMHQVCTLSPLHPASRF
jgi:hypothetical protein